MRTRGLAAGALVVLAIALGAAQPAPRRLSTVAAILEFPQYFHLQTVVLRGEFVEDDRRLVFRAADHDLHLLNPSVAKSGPVEVRAQVVDVGKLERTDIRLGDYSERFKDAEWPRPGAHLVLNVTDVMTAELAATASIRALSLEPWKFEGQTVTVTGQFRGRNLFGDMPAAPGASRYDFVLTGVDGALWVTNIRPRGRGFDLDVERRADSVQWLQVTGVAGRHRGLATISGTTITTAEAPKVTDAPIEAAPAPAPVAVSPLQVVFSSPTPDETDVSPTSPVRIQFSRGLREASLKDQIRVSYVGDGAPPIVFKATYDSATRALRLEFAAPLESYRTVKVELLEAIRAFDNGAFSPWTLTFSVGRR